MFPAIALQRFAGGDSSNGERRRGSLRGSARQKDGMAKGRDDESERWEVQYQQRFAGGGGFGDERRRGSSEGSSLQRQEWREWERDGDDAKPSPLYRRGA
jgi:hypothetical protein